jgi:hypothetical protein
MVPDIHMYLYRATVYMCIGWRMMLARARAERAPRSEAPALALASTVSGHDGGGHHGGDECGGEGSGEGQPAPSLYPLPSP